MQDEIHKISSEIWNLPPKTKVNFNIYFDKHEVPNDNKLECFREVMHNLDGWLSVDKKYKKEVGTSLPYNLLYVKNKKRVKESTPVNKEGIEEIISILENETPYEEVPSTESEDDIIIIGYINYDSRIMKLSRHIPFYEDDYNKKIEKLLKKDIEKLSATETRQIITFIYRKERFCTGHIKTYIDNGLLVKLLKHFIEIYQQKN